MQQSDVFTSNRLSKINCILCDSYTEITNWPAKVTKFKHGRLRIQQKVLGFYVTMTDPEGMDVGQTPEELVHVQLQW